MGVTFKRVLLLGCICLTAFGASVYKEKAKMAVK